MKAEELERKLTIIRKLKEAKTRRNQRIQTYVDVYNLVDPREKSKFEHGITNFPQAAVNLGI